MTLAELRDRVWVLLAEPGPGFFSNEEIDYNINEGIRDVADRTEAVIGSKIVEVEANTLEVPLPDDLIRVKKVSVGGRKLSVVSPEALDEDVPGWEETAGTPTNFFQYGRYLVLYPKPAESIEIKLWGVTSPPMLLNDEDDCGLPEYLQPLVVLYARLMCKQKDDTPLDVLMAYHNDYVNKCEQARRRIVSRSPKPVITVRAARGSEY